MGEGEGYIVVDLRGGALELLLGLANGDTLGDAYRDVLGKVESYALREGEGGIEENHEGFLLGLSPGQADWEKLGNVLCEVEGIVLGEVEGDVLGEVEGNIEGDHEGCVRGLLLGMTDGDKLGNVLGDTLGKVEDNMQWEVDGDALGEGEGTIEGDLYGGRPMTLAGPDRRLLGWHCAGQHAAQA